MDIFFYYFRYNIYTHHDITHYVDDCQDVFCSSHDSAVATEHSDSNGERDNEGSEVESKRFDVSSTLF